MFQVVVMRKVLIEYVLQSESAQMAIAEDKNQVQELLGKGHGRGKGDYLWNKDSILANRKLVIASALGYSVVTEILQL